MATAQDGSGLGSSLRTAFGVLLFVAWGIATGAGRTAQSTPSPRVIPVRPSGRSAPLLLMSFSPEMEGLEVAVIDRWRELYPERSNADLAGWLSARQLFVALIVTTATLLAEPDSIIIPFSSMEIRGGFALKAFTIAWTGFTVLWFMQIFPSTWPRRTRTATSSSHKVRCSRLSSSCASSGSGGRVRCRPRRPEPAQLARRADPREGADHRNPGRGVGGAGPGAGVGDRPAA